MKTTKLTATPKPWLVDWFWMHLAWILPRRLAYWATIRVAIKAPLNGKKFPEITCDEIFKAWGE